MALRDIIGQDRAVSSLTSALASNHLHHAYLFGGPDGVGKETCARALAQACNCESGQPDACGQCGPCLRIEKRNHADLVWILPEAEQVARGWAGRSDFEGTPSREIKISQIRALQERLSFKALEARRKFAVIADADAMNVQAQNALLKTLEEPPEATTIILVSSAPQSLLPTIRSRCLKLSFAPLPVDLIARRVQEEKKTDPETARLCAVLGEGSLSAALALDPASLARRKELLEKVESLASIREALSLAAEFGADRSSAELHLDLLSSWYRDLAAVGSGAPPQGMTHQDLLPLAEKAVRKLGAAEALRRIDLCASARSSLRGNASPRLQLEQLLLRFQHRDL